MVGALVKLADHPGAVGEVFNIGNDHEEITILDLAAAGEGAHGLDERDRDRALRQGLRGGLRGHAAPGARPHARCARSIGYEPKVHLDEILDRVIEYFTSDKAPGDGWPVTRDERRADAPLSRTSEARRPLGRLRRGRRASRTSSTSSSSPLYTALPHRRGLRQPGPAAHSSAPWPRSSSAWASTPASSASTTTSTPTTSARRLAGTVALFAAGGQRVALRWRVVVAAPAAHAALLGPGAPAAWVVLVAADVYLGTFAFVPLSLLRIQDRPAPLLRALRRAPHLSTSRSRSLLVLRGFGVAGVLWSDLAGHRGLRARPPARRWPGRAAWPSPPPACARCSPSACPRSPHGLMVQVLNLADRKILDLLRSRWPRSASTRWATRFGAGVKFALSRLRAGLAAVRLRRMRRHRTRRRRWPASATYAFAVFVAAGPGRGRARARAAQPS